MTLPITKTPKCYIGGSFVRSESGRVRELTDLRGRFIANIPLCSRKDLRNAVEAAAKAAPVWSRKTPYNRGQIIYRIAEMMESRAAELVGALAISSRQPELELRTTIDRMVHYAGWADKYEQVLGSVNPVASRHLNFTVSGPLGVVGIIAPDTAPLLALASLILPVIISGNTVAALSPATTPIPAILLGEILAVSDLPPGVVNLLTGEPEELLSTYASHRQIRAIHGALGPAEAASLESAAATSVKHIRLHRLNADWLSNELDSPYTIRDFTEAKTIWHPMGA